MKRILLHATHFILLTIIFSCNKIDFRNQEQPDPFISENAMRGYGNTKSNFIYATSPWLSGGVNPDYRLFTKEYTNGKLSRITASIQNIVTGGYDSFPLRVKYSYRRMDFIDDENTGQTVAKFHFDQKGNLITASLGQSSFPFHYSQPITYRLYYVQGRLKEIKYQWNIDVQDCENYPQLCADPPPLHPYLKIYYDNHKNISSMTSGEPSSFTYEYDLRKKIKDQFYADEAIHDYFDFWFFLRYLDIIPELRPQHLLKRSVYVSPEGYVTRHERKYHNQKFINGHLTSYDVQTRSSYISENDSYSRNGLEVNESWKVYWEMCREN